MSRATTRLSLAQRTSNFTITQACWELRTTAAVRARIMELSIVQATATACSYGFGRPAARGVTPTTPVAFQRDADGADGATTGSLAWGTSPTAPAAYVRRFNSGVNVGLGTIISWPNGLMIPVSASFVIFNITTAVAIDVNCFIDESN